MTDEILTPPAVNTLSFQPSVGGTKPPDHDIQDSLLWGSDQFWTEYEQTR